MRELSADAERQGEAVEAAVRVFAEYGGFIRSLIRLCVRDVSRRDDAFQELFLGLIERPMPPGLKNIRGYLYRMILRDAIDLTREEDNQKRYLKKYAEGRRIFIYKRPSLSALLEEPEIKGSGLERMVRRLRRREAQVLILRYWDSFSLDEIAAEVGIDRRSVSRYLWSGVKELRKMLAVQ